MAELKIDLVVDNQGSVTVQKFVVDAERALSRVGGVASGAGTATEQAMNRAASSTSKATTSANQLSGSMSSLGSVAKGALAVFSGYELMMFGKSVVDTVVHLDNLQRSMVAIAGSQKAAADEMTYLREVAASTGQNFYKLTDDYRQLTAATKGSALEGAKTRAIFQSLSEASAVLGLSSERVSLSIRAIGQMASKGTVQMEELKNQLGDHIPGAVQITARALGLTTKELYDLSSKGELLAEEVVPALAAELSKLYKTAANTAALESGQAAMNKLAEAWTEFKASLLDNDAVVMSINAVTNAIKGLSWYMQELKAQNAKGMFPEIGLEVEASKRSVEDILAGLPSKAEMARAKISDLQQAIEGVNSSLEVRRERGISYDKEAQMLRSYTKELEQQQKILKEEITPSIITGEAIAKTDIATAALAKYSFVLQGVRVETEKEREASRKNYETMLKYTETREQALEREFKAALLGARTEQEQLAVRKRYEEDLKKLSDQRAKSGERSAKASETEAKRFNDALNKLLPLRREQEQYARDVALLEQALAKGVITQEQYNQGVVNAERAMSSYKESIKAAREEVKELAEMIKNAEEWQIEINQVLMTDAERQIDQLVRQNELWKEQLAIIVKLDGSQKEWAENASRGLDEKLIKQIQEVNDQASEIGKLFEKVADDIQDAFSDMFMDMIDGSEDFFDAIIKMFKKLLAEMATMAIARPIIVPIVTAVGGAMGVSESTIAKTLGMSTDSLSQSGDLGIGGELIQGTIGKAYDYIFGAGAGASTSASSAYMSSAYGASAWDTASIYGSSAYESAYASVAGESVAGSASTGLSSTATSAWMAGITTFIAGLLQGQDFKTAAAQGVGAGGGMYVGAKAGATVGSYFGPAGTAVGGVIGGAIGAIAGALGMGSLMSNGTDTFMFTPAQEAYRRNYVAGQGIPISDYEFTGGGDNAIFRAYGDIIRAVQQSFNAQVEGISAALPQSLAENFQLHLSVEDLNKALRDASLGEYDVNSAQQAMQDVVTRYTRSLMQSLSVAYAKGLDWYLSTEGASALVGGEDIWIKLADATQERITSVLKNATTMFAAGDADSGMAAIQGISDAIAMIGRAMAPVQEIIDTDGMSEYELAIRSINRQFDDYGAALQAAGVDLEKYTELEQARSIILGRAWDQEQKRLEEEQKRLMRDQLKAQMADLGKQAELMVVEFGDLGRAMEELDQPSQVLVDVWRATKSELEALISGLATAMADVPEPTALDALRTTLSTLSSVAAGISNINEMIYSLQTGDASDAAITVMRNREAELWALLESTTDPAGVSGRLAQTITARISMQAKLEEQAVNDRFKAEYDAAVAVAKLEKDNRKAQITALKEQIKNAESLVNIVAGIQQYVAELKFSNLSALNFADQLDAAKGNYMGLLQKAMAGDADAAKELRGAAGGYLQEAQQYYGGATSEYAGIYNTVVAALERFGSTPVTDIDLLQGQLERLEAIEDATVEMQSTAIETADRQIAALSGINAALERRQADLERQRDEQKVAVDEQIEQLRSVVSNQEAQIRQQGEIYLALKDQIAGLQDTLDNIDKTASLEAAQA